MLTPQDLKEKTFSKAVFGGYDMSGVDDFIDTVCEDYGALYKENAILKNKLKVLVDKVEEYRSTEDAMRLALMNAQKMADDIVEKANQKSEELVKKAEEAAYEKIGTLKDEVQTEELRLKEAKKATGEFVSAVELLCKKHEEFITNLNKLELPKPEPKEESASTIESFEDLVGETAKDIEDSVFKIFEEAEKPQETESEPEKEEKKSEDLLGETRKYDVSELKSKEDLNKRRSKMRRKFDDLQFGSNYKSEDE